MSRLLSFRSPCFFISYGNDCQLGFSSSIAIFAIFARMCNHFSCTLVAPGAENWAEADPRAAPNVALCRLGTDSSPQWISSGRGLVRQALQQHLVGDRSSRLAATEEPRRAASLSDEARGQDLLGFQWGYRFHPSRNVGLPTAGFWLPELPSRQNPANSAGNSRTEESPMAFKHMVEHFYRLGLPGEEENPYLRLQKGRLASAVTWATIRQ